MDNTNHRKPVITDNLYQAIKNNNKDELINNLCEIRKKYDDAKSRILIDIIATYAGFDSNKVFTNVENTIFNKTHPIDNKPIVDMKFESPASQFDAVKSVEKKINDIFIQNHYNDSIVRADSDKLQNQSQYLGRLENITFENTFPTLENAMRSKFDFLDNEGKRNFGMESDDMKAVKNAGEKARKNEVLLGKEITKNFKDLRNDKNYSLLDDDSLRVIAEKRSSDSLPALYKKSMASSFSKFEALLTKNGFPQIATDIKKAVDNKINDRSNPDHKYIIIANSNSKSDKITDAEINAKIADKNSWFISSDYSLEMKLKLAKNLCDKNSKWKDSLFKDGHALAGILKSTNEEDLHNIINEYDPVKQKDILNALYNTNESNTAVNGKAQIDELVDRVKEYNSRQISMDKQVKKIGTENRINALNNYLKHMLNQDIKTPLISINPR